MAWREAGNGKPGPLVAAHVALGPRFPASSPRVGTLIGPASGGEHYRLPVACAKPAVPVRGNVRLRPCLARDGERDGSGRDRRQCGACTRRGIFIHRRAEDEAPPPTLIIAFHLARLNGCCVHASSNKYSCSL